MLSCKEASRLLSEAMDRKLSLGEHLQLKFHLAMCEGCRNFGRQMNFLRFACHRYVARQKDLTHE